MYGGSVGSITNSCKDYKACGNLAMYRGEVGNIMGSCNGTSSCSYAGWKSGDISSITYSCFGDSMCTHLKVGVVVVSQALVLVIIPVMEWGQESLVGWAILKNRVTPTMLVNLLDRMFLIRTTK